MSQSDGSSRQHSLEAALKVCFYLVRPTRMSSNVFPHDVNHRGADQAVLDDKREQIRFCVLHDGPHDVDSAAGIGRDLLVCQRLRVRSEVRVPVFAAVRLIVHVEDLVYLFHVNQI